MDVYVVHDLKNVEDYFYAETKLGRENDVYVYLSKRYHNRCLSCDLIAKEDLDLFRDIADVMKARKELQPIVKRNIERKKRKIISCQINCINTYYNKWTK
ncbi:unnamed protein product [Rotaria socialis]|uniref:Uncharacterized protein n=1 Tax=Rotaria socialis TaxID=392032 RepID=A0A817VI24_9BILA|nr:unnamed protein product [Rotaria socialis]CAF3327217.1 unnamed protein product [Rotaria socialis]CAF3344499.1 unnamed protein product [Rotaria socialis]CAF3358439.1 unnamed protein product [Rotaria socialis]CAF3689635.1 unnamed protein product [Rotaria socialis]